MATIISNDEIVEAWDSMHAKQFDWQAPMPERPNFMFRIEIDGIPHGFATEASIIEIDGMSKSRKSTMSQIMTAATLREDKRYMNVYSNIPDGKVLYFDTEQTKDEFTIFQRTLGRMCFWDPDRPQPERYSAFHLRPYSQAVRMAMIKHAFELYENLSLVVIDGMADVLEDSNDNKESLALVTLITQLCDLAGATLITNIHTVKAGNTSTGMLGGYLDKKASAHFRARKNEFQETELSPVHIRGAGMFKSFVFTHCAYGIPTINDLKLFNKRPLIAEVRVEQHKQRMREITKQKMAPYVSDFVEPDLLINDSPKKDDVPF